jgi:exopolysaccharide biosynthesis WecB/TagA/CpsF family protein
MQELLQAVRSRLLQGCGFAVATINLDHLYKLSNDDSFYRAYNNCEIVTADGAPIVLIGKYMGHSVEQVTGADLVRPMAKLASELKIPVAILGSSEASRERAATILQVENRGLEVVFKESPMINLSNGTQDAVRMLERLRDSGARICFLAFGAPKQELIAALGREICPRTGFFCVGAAIDFLSGDQTRAPKFLQAIVMEWLWRLAHNPKRLASRYLHSFRILPQVVVASLTYGSAGAGSHWSRV